MWTDAAPSGTNLSVFLFIFIADLLVLRGDLLDWQLPWSRQNTMPVCPATPWDPSPANSVAANRPRGLMGAPVMRYAAEGPSLGSICSV